MIMIKKKIIPFIPPIFIKWWVQMKDSIENNYIHTAEINRIHKFPRYQRGEALFADKEIHFLDSNSFLSIYKELFLNEIYKFDSTVSQPYIIDAGANVGLAIIYFKLLFPTAEVVGFEPDEAVFEVLEKNIRAFNFQDVSIHKTGLWDEEKTLKFYSEGADAGRVALEEDDVNIVEIQTELLSPYLDRKVDFLKIDIEGAEYTVLKECRHLLHKVQRIFVEYHSFVGKEQVLPELLGMLKDAGFRLNINTPTLVSKSPLHTVRTYLNMDLQVNIFGYREVQLEEK